MKKYSVKIIIGLFISILSVPIFCANKEETDKRTTIETECFVNVDKIKKLQQGKAESHIE